MNNQPQHKQGPWRTVTDGISHWVEIDGKIVIVSKGKNAKANANLIAAAPDMYEALDDVCKGCLGKLETNCTCRVCNIGKALRKARGEEE